MSAAMQAKNEVKVLAALDHPNIVRCECSIWHLTLHNHCSLHSGG